MSLYVKTDPDGISNPVRYSLGELRRENPTTSFPRVIPENVLEEYNVYPLLEDLTKPEFDPCAQRLMEVIEHDGTNFVRRYQIENLPIPQVIANKVEKVAQERFAKETGGIIWLDTNSGKLWYIATDLDSQGRINAAKTAVDQGFRVDGSVWKTAEINPSTGEFTLTYRPTTNAEITAWAQLVHTHVQKCFTAEGMVNNKLFQGDFSSSFQQEFDSL